MMALPRSRAALRAAALPVLAATLAASLPAQFPGVRNVRLVQEFAGRVALNENNNLTIVDDRQVVLSVTGVLTGLGTLGGYAYFVDGDPATGVELYRTDGTAAGTGLFADLNPGTASSNPFPTKVLGGVLFVQATVGFNDEVWRVDGTATGTWRLGIGDPSRIAFAGATGRYVYRGNGPEGRELHVSDGSPSSGGLLVDIQPGIAGSDPDELVQLGGRVVFTARDSTNGSSLWVTDGTAAGTTLLRADCDPLYLAAAGGRIYFRGRESSTGYELWATDGSVGGTVMVADLVPGSFSSAPQRLAPLGDGVVFYANTPAEGVEPWYSDGTGAGTLLLRDITPGSRTSALARADFVRVGSRRVRFVYGNANGGLDIWETNGTSAGTQPAIVDGIEPMVVANGRFYHGRQISPTSTQIEFRNEVLDAVAHPTGHACAADGRQPALRATDPILGGSLRLDGAAPAGTTAFVLLGVPTARPFDLGSGCFLMIDAASLSILGSAPIAAGSQNWSITLPIPAGGALDGILAAVQALHGPTNGVRGLDVTNAVVLRFGH